MAIEADVPIIPGVDHAVHGLEEVTKIANQVGYPVMLKASNRWWRTWNAYRSFSRRDSQKNMQEARDEYQERHFGDDQIFVENT